MTTTQVNYSKWFLYLAAPAVAVILLSHHHIQTLLALLIVVVVLFGVCLCRNELASLCAIAYTDTDNDWMSDQFGEPGDATLDGKNE